MHRDLSQLTAGTFDVLVVGGGIYGLAIAYDAVQRGLSVALIDRADFGSGSSFNPISCLSYSKACWTPIQSSRRFPRIACTRREAG